MKTESSGTLGLNRFLTFFKNTFYLFFLVVNTGSLIDFNTSPHSPHNQFVVKAVHQEPVLPGRRGNLCVVLTVFFVLKERPTIKQVHLTF